MRRSGSPPDPGRPLGRKGSWRAPERLGGHERLIGPALELAQAVFGFPDHFFKGRRCRFVMYEITKSPIALQIALQLLPLVHSPPPADGCAPVQQQPRDRFRPPPLFDGCVTVLHQWERLARADGSAIMTTASETASYPDRNRACRSARRSARHRHRCQHLGRAPGPLRHGHRRRDGGDAAKRLQHRLHDLWCHLLVGGVIGMALMRPESETMRWANEMPEAAVEPT
jgi:hypothetical protein